ncbi:TVP38/TMEM64 family protein [Candidatus Kaiserbacteria bacterium]|nr:TVP38/TMEM64 family protein [Candidatus Kaiserbacteria bacterium]
MPNIRKDVLVNLAVLVIAMGALYIAIRTFGGDEMQRWIEGAGPLAPIALVAAKASTIIFAPLSGALIYPLAGTLFGFWKGFALSVLGDTIGGAVAFWISRLWGRRVVEKMLGSDTGLLGKILEMIGTVKGFLFTRIIFITAQDILAYAAGLTKLPFLPYITIHIGISLVPTSILTGLGSVLLENPTPTTLGLLFGGMSAIGVISMLAFMYFSGFQFADTKERAPEESTDIIRK